MPPGAPSGTMPHPRAGIRSWVLRTGRMTPGQKRAIEQHWPRFGLGLPPDPGGVIPSAADGPPIAPQSVFGRSAPLVVEIGFGRGDTLLAAARAHPERDHIGIEVHPPGIGYLLARLYEGNLDNVRVLCADGREALRHRFAPAALDELWLFFPDPWPKARHHKRRLVQRDFVALAATRLRPGGQILAATDHEEYAQEMLSCFEAEPALRNVAGAGSFAAGRGERPRTRFEERGERHGAHIREFAFERIPTDDIEPERTT